MDPANNEITLFWVMSMVFEMRTFVFEFDPDMFPLVVLLVKASLPFTIWVVGTDRLNVVAEFLAYQPNR